MSCVRWCDAGVLAAKPQILTQESVVSQLIEMVSLIDRPELHCQCIEFWSGLCKLIQRSETFHTS